jgi:hypothetical protein
VKPNDPQSKSAGFAVSETQRHRGHRVAVPSVTLRDLCASVFSFLCRDYPEKQKKGSGLRGG